MPRATLSNPSPIQLLSLGVSKKSQFALPNAWEDTSAWAEAILTKR